MKIQNLVSNHERVSFMYFSVKLLSNIFQPLHECWSKVWPISISCHQGASKSMTVHHQPTPRISTANQILGKVTKFQRISSKAPRVIDKSLKIPPACIGLIVNFPFLSSSIPSGPCYGVYISQLIRYAQCCSHHEDFRYRHKCLVDRLMSRGYRALRLEKSFKKFYGRYQDLIDKYQRSVNVMVNDSFPG